MVLASARLRGIHPPDNIQNGGCPGGECLSNAHWLGPWRQHFDDESWRGRVTRVDLLCTLFCDTGHTHTHFLGVIMLFEIKTKSTCLKFEMNFIFMKNVQLFNVLRHLKTFLRLACLKVNKIACVCVSVLLLFGY